MFNSVQYVRDICQERKIPISQLEKECGFSNGYLNPKKMTKISYDRALTIASYLGISVSMILSGKDEQKEMPVPSKQDERGSRIMFALSKGGRREITDEMFDEVMRFAEYIGSR